MVNAGYSPRKHSQRLTEANDPCEVAKKGSIEKRLMFGVGAKTHSNMQCAQDFDRVGQLQNRKTLKSRK